MAYSETINLVQNDTGPVLFLHLRDSNKAASGQTLERNNPDTWADLDLTGATVRFRIRAAGADAVKDTIVCQILNAAQGKVAVHWQPTSLDTEGVFEGEVEITDSAGVIQTVYDLIRLRVRADF